MAQHPTLSAHLRATLALGLPLIGSHLAQMALHVVDTVLMGWYGVTELAAMVLAGSSFFVVFILGAGFAQAVMPMAAQALGAGDDTRVRRDTRMGLWLSIGYGLLTYPVFWFSGAIFLALGQQPEVAALGQDFLRIAGWGMIPALAVMALKSTLSAAEHTQVMLWTTLGAVVLNAAVAYPLIFGLGGLPEMGLRGAAVASLSVQIFTLAVLALYAARAQSLRHLHLWQRFWRPDWPALAQVFRLGWPIGVTGLAESGLFQAAALMMGWIGTVELAAHGIAMQLASLTFMLHLGLSNAATVRAGRAAGAGEARSLRDGAKVAIGMSLGLAVIVITLFLTLPEPLVRAFIDPTKAEAPRIVAYGTALLAMAALFQLADAMQVMALGLLRGIRDTRWPMWFAALSYWGVGIPTSYLLAFRLGWGGTGLWLGLVLGLCLAAVLLMVRFWRLAPRS